MFGFAWIVALAVAGVGLVLCIPRFTRFAGVVAVVTGMILLVGFHGAFWTLGQLGRVKFPIPEPMVEVGPNVKASLLVYFKSGTRNAEIEAFLKRVIYVPPSRKGAYEFRQGVSRLLRIPSVEGHEGIAVDFDAATNPEKRRELIEEVLSDRSVYRILTDSVPSEVVSLD